MYQPQLGNTGVVAPTMGPQRATAMPMGPAVPFAGNTGVVPPMGPMGGGGMPAPGAGLGQAPGGMGPVHLGGAPQMGPMGGAGLPPPGAGLGMAQPMGPMAGPGAPDPRAAMLANQLRRDARGVQA